jgi:DNA-binding transcriptional regulator of glucitol operon
MNGFFGQAFWFFVAIAIMLALQLYGASRQSRAFMAQVMALRASGRVAIGLGGKRWLGRKAYVALAVQDARVVEAVVLRGLTQFARAKPAPQLVGHTLNKLAGKRSIPGIDAIERAAARQAAETLKASGGWQPTGGATQGKESVKSA